MRQKPRANQDVDEDQILWQRVTQRVTPLPGRNRTLSSSPAFKNPVHANKSALNSSKKTPSPARAAFSTAIAKPLSPVVLREGDRAGLDGRTQRRLSRGDVPIDRVLIFTAIPLLVQSFIEDASIAGCRCLLVITGKGAGVLKRHVPEWLKQPPLSGLVLALAEARPVDGGSGAFYVLLRRRR